MKNVNKFKQAIEDSNSILIMSHVSPDGDTISSNLALRIFIQKYFNKKAQSVYIGKLPDVYNFLPDFDKFENINDIDKTKKYDLVIAVDIAAKDRMGDAVPLFDGAKINVNIDHHKTNNNFGIINFVDPVACSAGQVVFDIIESLEMEFTEDISTCLYTSILTDTGCFKYENTSIKTFQTAAKLVKFKANPCEISRACYDSKPQNMVQFQVFTINNAIFSKDGKIAYSIISKAHMKQFNATDDFSEGISESLRQIKTVEVSMVLKETDNHQTKVSLRSKHVDVSKIAEVFNGGGHMFAAGCTIKKPPHVAANKLLEYIARDI